MDKICEVCSQSIDERYYLKTHSPFFPKGRLTICTPCLERAIDGKDMSMVDRFCRWADYPFLINEWTKLYQSNGEQTLRVYSQMYFGGAYEGIDWEKQNRKLRTALENGTLEKGVEVLRNEWRKEMRKKWFIECTDEEFERLEELHKDLLATQNVATGIQRHNALAWCKKALELDNTIAQHLPTKDIIAEMGNIIKAAGFEPKNARNNDAFDSLGELIVYCIRNGYTPKFYDDEDRDLVDLTMKDIQAYLRRLVLNEPGLRDQIEQRKHAYELSQQLEQTTDEEFDKYTDESFNVDLEGEIDLDPDEEKRL